ncbi:MFS transporter [Pannonibacter tanglangensis]|uniref:MFS transporter n=1 Tax=Pannonibacter tanglangensis TaxID=2750084 RepID=A0ABW9ZF89_9HYPH|nr:MFS transporter [Pannonibacter sp. XCT-34]NBN63500.1 MFS transporter [Pannonibacter sp. XCT-34]
MIKFQTGLSTRVSGLFWAHFIGSGIFLPFFPLLLSNRQLSVSEIATALALATIARIVAAPVLTSISDKTGRRRLSIFLYSLAGVVFLALFAFTDSYLATLIAISGLMIFWAPIIPLADAYALDVVRRLGGQYGRMRLWGSVAFIVGNLAGGWLISFSTAMPYLAGILLSLLATALVAITLPPAQPRVGAGAVPREVRPDVFRQPWFLAMLVAIGLLQASHAGYYAFATIFWRGAGVPDTLIGLIWSLGVVTEICLFIYASRLPGWFTPLRLILIGGLAGILRWMVFAEATSLWSIVLLQGLHGLSFGAVHLGTVSLLGRIVPSRWSATGQSLMATSIGLLNALATWASGPLYGRDPAFAFWFMSAVSLAGLVALLVLTRRVTSAAEQAADEAH